MQQKQAEEKSNMAIKHKQFSGVEIPAKVGLFDTRLKAGQPAGVSRRTGSVRMSSKDKKRVGYS